MTSPVRLTSLHVKNFKCLRDVEIKDIPPFAVFVGPNGAGKSTLFEVFGFLRDYFFYGEQRTLNSGGGFERFRSYEIESDEIIIDSLLKANEENHPTSCRLHSSRYPKKNLEHGLEITAGGKSKAFKDKESLILSEDFFKEAIIYDITCLPPRSKANQNDLTLKPDGSNAHNVALHLYKEHPDRFAHILNAVKCHVPGVTDIEVGVTELNDIFLKFKDGAFEKPFLSEDISDGTADLFTYLVMLNQPKPPSLMCVEEPERHLYPGYLAELAEEFRARAIEQGNQIFVSTHSPEFLNGVRLEELYLFDKIDGYTRVRAAKDIPQIAAYAEEGDKLGYLWNQGLFDGDV